LRLSEYYPYIVKRVAGALRGFSSGALDDLDNSRRIWRVLAALGERNGRRVTDLVGVSLIEVSTLSRLLDRMEAQGLVEKRRARPNARSVTVHITPAGRSVLKAAWADALRYQASLLEGIPKRDLETARAVLERIHENALVQNR